MSGTVTASPFLVPTGTVDITVNGQMEPVTVNSSGYFTDATFGTQAIPASATPYPIAYAFEGDGKVVYSATGSGSFESISDLSKSLTVNQATTSVSTAISDSSGGAVTSVLGEEVYDTATVSGTPAAFAPTGNVNYYLSTNGGAYSLFDTEPVGTQSLNTASLPAGSYSFEAQYLGDGNYQESPMSAPEPLTITQGTTSVSTAISDSGGGAVTSVLGEKVYDTATVSGTPAAFTPTGNVNYYLYDHSGGVTSQPV